MGDRQRDADLPFGTVYFGAVIAVLGLLLTVVSPVTLGPVLAISGVLFACTGLVLRGLARLSRAAPVADPERTLEAPRP